MDQEVLGGEGRPRAATRGDDRLDPSKRNHWRASVCGLLVVLLLAALFPIASAPSAAAAGTLIELPAGFTARKINNSGQVAGFYHDDSSAGLAIWTDGNLQRIPLSTSIPFIIDFSNDGEILTSVNNQLTIYSTSGVRTLPKPVIGEQAKNVYNGWGPADDGRVVGIHPWDYGSETNGVVYEGASPPAIITELSTVLAVNKAGQVFGQLPGSGTPKFGILSQGAVSPASGFATAFPGPVDFSDAGHLLYAANGVYHLWHEGSSVPLDTGFFVPHVNRHGVVSMSPEGPNGEFGVASIRFPDGTTNTVRSLVGGAPGWRDMYGDSDINDDCWVIGSGSIDNPDGTRRGASYLAKVGGCAPVDLEGDFFRVDGGSAYAKVGEDTEVRLRVENAGSEQVTNLSVTSTEVVADGDDAGAAELNGSPTLSSTTLDATGPGSLAFADFTLVATEPGPVTLRAEVSGRRGGDTVTGTIEREFDVREDDLVVNLELDPPEYEQSEDGTFEPIDITATVSFTNNTNEDMTDLRLQDLDVSRVFSGQELHVTYKSGIRPDPIDPEVIVPLLEPDQTSEEFTAVFTATENNEVDFSALASAANGVNGTATGLTVVRWKAKVKKFVEIETTIEFPEGDELLQAGAQIIINGTVENLSNQHDVTLGPLYPTLVGNTGTMNVGYDGPAANPTVPVATPPMELEPGQERTFQVRIRTNYSDPRMYGAEPSGGTRAYVTFEPWGEAIERQDGDATEAPERVEIRTYDEASPGDGSSPGDEPDAQVKADPSDLFKRISIDDSIELPEREPVAVAAGIMKGAAEGLVNAAIATIYAIPDLVKMPYTVLVAAYDYQAKVWESFTEEEKDLFLTETSFLIVSVLQRNVEFGLKDAGELYDQVYAAAGEHLTKTQNDWQTGDYLATTEGYSAFLSEQIGSVAGPVILSKMAQSPKAVAALDRLQTAINTRMAATFAQAKNIKYVDNVLPILQSIENGAEPTLTAIAKLWGVTPEEIAEYKRICGIIGCIANIRSRHASSIEWIKKWGAMLKPENLKIKTVNELDVMLGYRFEDLGSVIFRRPEILKNLGPGATKEAIKAEAKAFARSKGFKDGTKEFTEAVTRLEDRASEWNKYQKTYSQWNDRGWIDTSFNYEGNAIPEYKFDANGNVIGKLTGADKGNYKGFRMVETEPGSEEFIVQMLDGKTGKWRRITGDIDPVDFTYTDGSPLSPEDHARLINLLQNSPIGAEHGYTSTFLGFKDPKTGAVIVKPGPELVKKQFKPNEPALQIAPNANPRAARIDVEESRWVDPYNYNIRWINGFVDAGTGRGRGPAGATDALTDVVPLDAPAQVALPVKTKPPEPTVGRFVVQNGNKGDTAALIMGENGQLQSVNPDGTTQDSPLHDQAFGEGPTQTITVSPVSTLQEPEPNGGAPARRAGSSLALGLSAARYADDAALGARLSLAAGSNTIQVSTASGLASGSSGFEPGQQLAIGTGTDNLELVEVLGVNGGVLTLTAPLQLDHAPGEVVVMVVSAAGVPVDPTKGVDPAPDPGDGSGGGSGNGDGGGSGDGVGGTPGGTGSLGSGAGAGRPDVKAGTGGALAFTGADLWPTVYVGSLLTLLGMVLWATTRRRRAMRPVTARTPSHLRRE